MMIKINKMGRANLCNRGNREPILMIKRVPKGTINDMSPTRKLHKYHKAKNDKIK